MRFDWLYRFDMGLLELIAKLRSPFLDWLMQLFTHLGDAAIVWILFSLFLLLKKEYRPIGLMSLLALLIGTLITDVTLKPLFMRERPFTFVTDYELLIKAPGSFSFPSGHATSTFASGVVLWTKLKQYRIPIFVLMVLIPFSRLYLFVHFPSDVFVGAIIGILAAFLAMISSKKIIQYLNQKKTGITE